MNDMADRTLYLVFSNPVADQEDEFNRWYDEVHLREALATPGVLSAQRYKLADSEIRRDERMPTPSHRYLLIYEVEGDVDVVMANIRQAAATMEMSNALDFSSVAMSFWNPIGGKLVAS